MYLPVPEFLPQSVTSYLKDLPIQRSICPWNHGFVVGGRGIMLYSPIVGKNSDMISLCQNTYHCTQTSHMKDLPTDCSAFTDLLSLESWICCGWVWFASLVTQVDGKNQAL